jgi:hypothetical protein
MPKLTGAAFDTSASAALGLLACIEQRKDLLNAEDRRTLRWHHRAHRAIVPHGLRRGYCCKYAALGRRVA